MKKYLTGKDLNQNIDQSASRYIIDFQNWDLQEARKYKKPFKIVTEKVKPVRATVKRKKYREIWWRFQEEQMKLREKTEKLKKFIVTSLDVEKYRDTACKKQKIGLTSLYNELSEGDHDVLRKLHDKLDKAVAKIYDFSIVKLSDSEEIINFLLKLNQVYKTKKDQRELSAQISALLEKASAKSTSRKKKA